MTKKPTIIVSYQDDSDKTKFKNENKEYVDMYNIIYANNRDINGVSVELIPEDF